MKFTLKKGLVLTFIGFLGFTGLLTVTVNAKDVAKDAYLSLKSSYKSDSSINGILNGCIKGIENGFSSNVFGQNEFVNIYGLTQKGLDKEYIIDADSAYNIVKDNHNKLHFVAFKEDNTKAVSEIVEMNEVLSKNGIDFLYVQTPIKFIKGHTKLNPAIIDYSNENSDKIVAQLREGHVNTIDLRNLLDEAPVDKTDMFYNTDHHWTIETAFWGVGRVVEKLNTLYKLGLDSDKFYTDISNYKIETFENNFLGSQGRRVGKYFGGIDDFSLITPNYDTSYKVTVKKKNKTEVFEGDFRDAVIRDEILEDKDVFTNRYVTYFGADYPEVIIENKGNLNGKKILIVKDSFGIPFSAFMSTMASETRMLDTRYYKDKSVTDYALEYKPDIVLYVYRSIRTIN